MPARPKNMDGVNTTLANLYVTHLHETSLMSRFWHVLFNIPIWGAQSVLQIGENQKSIFFLDKIHFSAILCLATYDWFCADGLHIWLQAWSFICRTLVNLNKFKMFTDLVVIHDCVEGFNPHRVNVSIQDNPLRSIWCQVSQVSHDHREQT